MVMVVFLVFVQRVVPVEVFHVGRGLIRGVVALGTRLAVGRVALRHVDALVAFQDAGFPTVVVASAEVVVVIVGRVGGNGLVGGVVYHGTDALQEGLVVAEAALLFIVQTIESHVLQCPVASVHKRIVLLRGGGNLTPLRGGVSVAAVDGQAVFVEFLTIVQDVLAHLSKVDVQLAAKGAVVAGIGKGVHHPEFYVLDVGHLEIVGVEFAHHAAPSHRWIGQRAVGIQVRVEVIRTALLGIVGQVEHGLVAGGAAIGALVAVGEELAHIHLAHIMIGKLFQVATDMTGRERRTLAGEQRVDVVPGQQGAVVAAPHGVLVGAVGHQRRHARDGPRRRYRHVDAARGILEVVQI